jgi:hypothetical protein
MLCRREASWHHQNSKVWNLGFTCMCGGGLLAWSSKLRVPMGQQFNRLESCGIHKTMDVLGPTFVGAWASRSHSSCWRHSRAKPVGSRIPEASCWCWDTRIHGIYCRNGRTKACKQQEHWGLAAATSMGKPSLWVVGVLRPTL